MLDQNPMSTSLDSVDWLQDANLPNYDVNAQKLI